MGTILTGYGEDAYDHEGYPAQVLDDGSITSTCSPATRPRRIGQVVAACGCGWAGTTRYRCPEPGDAQAEALALAEWEFSHARPALDQAQHQRARRLAQLLDGLATDHRAYLEVPAPRPTRQRLDLLDRTLRTLATANDLARELRDQVAASERGTGR